MQRTIISTHLSQGTENNEPHPDKDKDPIISFETETPSEIYNTEGYDSGYTEVSILSDQPLTSFYQEISLIGYEAVNISRFIALTDYEMAADGKYRYKLTVEMIGGEEFMIVLQGNNEKKDSSNTESNVICFAIKNKGNPPIPEVTTDPETPPVETTREATAGFHILSTVPLTTLFINSNGYENRIDAPTVQYLHNGEKGINIEIKGTNPSGTSTPVLLEIRPYHQ